MPGEREGSRLRLQSKPISDKRQRSCRSNKIYIYFGVWCTVATVLAVRWLRDFNAPFIIIFAAVYAFLMIVIDRWLFGRKTLWEDEEVIRI